MAIDTAKLVKAYRNLRDARAELKKKYEEQDIELKLKMEKIESTLLMYMNETGQTSGATPHGTFYKQMEVRPIGSDWGAFYAWVKQHDAFEALEKRIARGFITKYMEDQNGAIPPGVTVNREWVVRIRKA